MNKQLKIWISTVMMVVTAATSQAINYSVANVESWNYKVSATLRGVRYDNEVATAIHLTTTDPSVGADHQSIWTYCTDFAGALNVPQVVSFDRISGVGQTGLDPRNPWGAGGFQNAAFLVDKYGASAAASPIKSAGLALAVWETLYDSTGLQQGSFDFSSGSFRVRSVTDKGMLSSAKTYLAALDGSDYTPINNYWLRPSTSGFPGNVGQGLIDPVRGGGSVPEGGVTIGLLGMALGGLMLLRKP
jgi:hypothetical protein